MSWDDFMNMMRNFDPAGNEKGWDAIFNVFDYD
jgi:hypothetical protein